MSIYYLFSLLKLKLYTIGILFILRTAKSLASVVSVWHKGGRRECFLNEGWQAPEMLMEWSCAGESWNGERTWFSPLSCCPEVSFSFFFFFAEVSFLVCSFYFSGFLDVSIRADLDPYLLYCGLLRWHNGKESACQRGRHKEMPVWSLGLEDPLEKETATHFGILAWEIPSEEPGGLQSMGS